MLWLFVLEYNNMWSGLNITLNYVLYNNLMLL